MGSDVRESARLHCLVWMAALVWWPGCARALPADADHGMVAAAHPLAARAGVEVLVAGGSAADVAVATALALAVVEPYASGLGGGGLILIFDAARREARALDCRETAPAAARADMFLRDGVVDSLASCDGGLSVAVPGLVRGLWELHATAGRLPWERLCRPAIALARDGFPVGSLLREMSAANAARLSGSARALFLPAGQPPPLGSLLFQDELARTLEAIADRGADGFHAGPVAAALAAAVQEAGGVLTVADLAGYRPVWREPLRGAYRGLTVLAMPPPSAGGGQLLQMLTLLEGFDLAALGYGSAAAWHLQAEAMRLSFADRRRWLGDPDFVSVPMARLLSPGRLDSSRVLISAGRALSFSVADSLAAALEPEHTTHLSVVDAEGNAVAATLTINLGFGSGLLAAGVLLNDEMDDFAAAPGAVNAFGLAGGVRNAVAPGKRPLSSMTPTILLRDGRAHLVLGSPGGSRIPTSVLQVIVNIVDFGMDVARAVGAPRIHHQGAPDLLYHEPQGMSPDTAALLAARGHVLAERAAIGNVQAILADPAVGRLRGAGDPRGQGVADGY